MSRGRGVWRIYKGGEGMDDTISRKAAIDALEKKKDKKAKGDIGGFYNKIIQNDIDTLMELPSAQPGWIPWDSGKLPEESGTYTVTAYDGATKRVTYAKYQKRLKRWELTGARAYWRVLAWMPLPEPYTKEEEDGND